MKPDETERNRRILVVDDNRAIHEDFRKILCHGSNDDDALADSRSLLFGDETPEEQVTPYLIDSAYQGDEALEKARAAMEEGRSYAVAFMDVRMPPGLDGIETTLKLWALDPEIQVVLCTAYSDYGWQQVRDKFGSSDRFLVLKKPFDTIEVLQLAEALSAKWHLARLARQQVEDLEARVAERTRALQLSDSALNATANAIAIVDSTGLIERVNPAFTKLTGYGADEVIGKNPRILKSGQHDPEFYQELWHTILAGNVWRGTFVNRRKDGTLYSDETTITPMSDATGVITHYIAIKSDITERLRMEEDLLQAKEAAEAAAQAKSRFLANMSHEIRTPMNGVIGMAGLLLDTCLTGEQREEVEIIRNSGEALLTIINDILDFSKIEAGKLTIEEVNYDLREAVEDTLEILAGHAQKKGIELVGAVDPNMVTCLRGDAGRVRQVLMNLVGNAVKFTNKGEVAVAVRMETESAPESVVRFDITDTGIGITPDVQARLFNAFEQADGSTSRRFGGTGLGLTISKQLVEAMGGQIGVESKPGAGSRFWFTLRQARQEDAGPDLSTVHHFANVRVLVVDDNETNCQNLHRQLDAWWAENLVAHSSDEGLAMLCDAAEANNPFRVALIDMQMPGSDGVALAKQIAADVTLIATQVILLIPFGKSLSPEERKASGVFGCLHKPVRQSLLFDGLINSLAGNSSEELREQDEHREVVPDAASHQIARVLIADDNKINQRVALGQLRKLGYDADVASNGFEVIQALERSPYDIVLMDCQMPEMDGYEATAEIRRRESNGEHHWIIAMTANSMQGDREKCLEAGMDGYVSKPVRSEQLSAALAGWKPQEAAPFNPQELQRIAADSDLEGSELIDLFLEIGPALLADLQNAVKSRDAKSIRHAAHTLKGSCSHLGAEPLRNACLELETAGRTQELACSVQRLAQVEKQYRRLVETLRTLPKTIAAK